MHRVILLLLVILLPGIAPALAADAAAPDVADSASAAADVPSFRRDVMPVFFRAGCNAGTCHG